MKIFLGKEDKISKLIEIQSHHSVPPTQKGLHFNRPPSHPNCDRNN